MLFERLDFALGPGDALLVTGENGSGKSSLLRLAAGLLAPAAGEIVRYGSIGLTDERPALDLDLPLAEALGFWARMDGGDVPLALAESGLSPLAEVPVRMLSTGQRRRASFARLLVQRAAIWLLDEPVNGLDLAAIARLEARVAAHRASGGLVLLASHQPFALADAQRVAL